MSHNYAQRNAERNEELREAKARADQANRVKFEEQARQHDQELQAIRNATDAKVKAEMEKVNAIREKQAAELAKLQADIDEIVKKQMKDLAVQGREKVERGRLELESKQENLKAKAKLIQDHLNVTGDLMVEKEKERQIMLNALDEKKVSDLRAHQEKILAMNEKVNEAFEKHEEDMTRRDAEQNKQLLARIDSNNARVMGAIVNTQQLQSSLALEDKFHAFKQSCNLLRKHHSNFTTEFGFVEPDLLKAHRRMMAGKDFDADLSPLLSALSRLTTTANSFDSAGSTKEEEFSDLIKKLRELLDDLRSELNLIQSRLEDEDDDDDEGSNKPKGIIEEIQKSKVIMRVISELIQKFNVVGRDHLQETLAIQMANIQIASASSSVTYAIQGPPAYERASKPAITEAD